MLFLSSVTAVFSLIFFVNFLMDSILLVISKMMDYIMGTKMHMNMGLKCGANP